MVAEHHLSLGNVITEENVEVASGMQGLVGEVGTSVAVTSFSP